MDFQTVLVRFALERILYCLAQSNHADRFLLKIALLLTLWYDMPRRATSDVDLLGLRTSDPDTVARIFRDIASVVVDNGIEFDSASVDVEEVRKDAGVRVIIACELANARIKTQIDVGFSDAVTPDPVGSIYPFIENHLRLPKSNEQA